MALISLALGGVAVAWLRSGRGRLWLQMTLTYAIGVGLALFNIFLTARLMFISERDLPILVTLLLFAGVASLALGVALALLIAGRVAVINDGARRIAAGDLSVRVATRGSDELTDLAHEFNRMAERLAQADTERTRQEVARRDLIGAVSHDLRTPLASLSVMLEALADGMVDDPATTTRYLATMRGQIKQLSNLIDDLFELSQIDAGALHLAIERVAAIDLVSDAIEGLRPQAAAQGITLHGSVAAGLPPLLVAPHLIERVLANLVSNAIRHTPPGGQITIHALPADPADSAMLRFEVCDTGEGIAAADLPYIFERFYRSEKSRSRSTGGAGLGLAIAHGIIAAHGGRIWIESTPGSGTSVLFLLPIAEIAIQTT
ncbi:MAG TPA: ATP-binding protein [Roseiflexaceae bacterium]|nr:ATP-binding protein [Roseiflexaceae bacterium]